MSVKPTPQVVRGGKKLSARVWALLEDAVRAAGLSKTALKVSQGSWSNASASAGTHSGGGAFDLRTGHLSRSQVLRLVHELRKRNVAAWYRHPDFGWSGAPHIHGIVKDEPGLSDGARQQVYLYNAGKNGLAGRGKDPHPRPVQRSFQYPSRPKPSRHLLHLLHLYVLLNTPGKQPNERPLTAHELHVIHVWVTEGREIP